MAVVTWKTSIHRGVPFTSLEAIQKECIERVRKEPGEAHLLLSEPQSTFTHGLFANQDDLLWRHSQLQHHQVAVHSASRGGKWTYHGPGQIVIYPIVSVRRLGYDRRAVYQLMNDLRHGVASGLTSLGLSPQTKDRPFGVYVGEGKIASFGMALHDGISSNGVAIYLENQSRYFQGIHPCGVAQEKVTSLTQEGIAQDWETIALVLAEHVKKGFKSA